MKKTQFLYLLFLIPASFFVYHEWHYLPFIYEGYDQSFNVKRKELGLPIIEDYFTPKNGNSKRVKIWLTPDSLKNEFTHYSKMYNTYRGEILFEKDSYILWDGNNIVRELESSYYFEYDSFSYKLITYHDNRKSEEIVSELVADSVLLEWSLNSESIK